MSIIEAIAPSEGGQTHVLLVDLRRLPLQVRALHPERVGRVLGADADGHEHRKVDHSQNIRCPVQSHRSRLPN